MISEKMFELMNRSLDGVTTPAEEESLRRYLGGDAEARQVYDDLRHVAIRLDGAPSVAAPENFTHQVMSHVPHRHVGKRGWLGGFLDWLAPHPGYGLGFGALAGAVTMAVILAGLGGGLDKSELGGAMVSKVHGAARLGFNEFAVGSASGSIEVKRNGNLVFVHVALAAAGRTTVDVGFDQSDLNLSSVYRENAAGGAIRVDDGKIDLTSPGNNDYLLIFADGSIKVSPIDVTVRQGSESDQHEITSGIAQ